MRLLLKGGREAASTNAALVDTLRGVLEKHGVADAVQLVSTREQIAEFLKMDDLIDLVIPRGSNEMVRTIQQSTKIPVLGLTRMASATSISTSLPIRRRPLASLWIQKHSIRRCVTPPRALLVHSKFPEREKC